MTCSCLLSRLLRSSCCFSLLFSVTVFLELLCAVNGTGTSSVSCLSFDEAFTCAGDPCPPENRRPTEDAKVSTSLTTEDVLFSFSELSETFCSVLIALCSGAEVDDKEGEEDEGVCLAGGGE